MGKTPCQQRTIVIRKIFRWQCRGGKKSDHQTAVLCTTPPCGCHKHTWVTVGPYYTIAESDDEATAIIVRTFLRWVIGGSLTLDRRLSVVVRPWWVIWTTPAKRFAAQQQQQQQQQRHKCVRTSLRGCTGVAGKDWNRAAIWVLFAKKKTPWWSRLSKCYESDTLWAIYFYCILTRKMLKYKTNQTGVQPHVCN